MNNIELKRLIRDAMKYLDYSKEDAEKIGMLPDHKINSVKKAITRNRKIEDIFKDNPQLSSRKIILPSEFQLYKSLGSGLSTVKKEKKIKQNDGRLWFKEKEGQKVNVGNRKPKILLISDVKGWAWWIKSEYLKKYLSDEFDITIVHVVGPNSMSYNKVDQQKYDLYFTYGYSYIDFLHRVHISKKVTGVTAHRKKRVIFPKMKNAGHQHANSKMLLKELHDMGFKRAYYIPNGVDEELFKPINPIKKEGNLVVGHVGKECPVKGQREFIIPAIQSAGVQSSTNLRTWKDKLPHKEMPRIYNEMDVFVVASVEDGTPNPALEAASCGRPIISNSIGNMPEFIKDGYNGFLVPRKIGAYVEKINYFKNNRDELIRMGENARKTILENWTWKKQAENYRAMFKNIFEIGKKV